MKLLPTLLCLLTLCSTPILANTPTLKLHTEARKQIGITTHYDPAYVVLQYPGGDIAPERGVCTDVIIRAMRGHGIDLQQEVHRDMRAHFSQYPKIWGLKKPDKNIDHRRVPNLRTYFTRRGWSLPITRKAADYKAGDIVTNTLPGNLPHIMIVSDRKTASGTPLVIHNVGSGTQEEDFLFSYPINGHYRVQKISLQTQTPVKNARGKAR